jgi:T4 RnlA family RNA ligase
MLKLEITEFIKTYPDWEERLSGSPYFIKVKRTDGFVLLKYDQIRSDLTMPIVRECRGIIFDETNNYAPVCVPFFKFGNWGESYVPDIDWVSATIQEKLDGSLIKLWYYKEKWHISSNGEIDARNAHISSALLTDVRQVNLYDLFMEAWGKTSRQFKSLDTRYTYMFELTSPHNRVVVRHDETLIRHIGTRSNITHYECDVDIGIQKPRTYNFSSLEACIENAKQLSYNDEGYVVIDKNFNRIKIKSPLYVSLSHISAGVTTHANIVEIIQKNEQDEFLTYFPEFRDVFEDIVNRIEVFSTTQSSSFTEIQAKTFDSRKALAEVVTKTTCPACLFALIDGKAVSAREWLLSRPAPKVLCYIGL